MTDSEPTVKIGRGSTDYHPVVKIGNFTLNYAQAETLRIALNVFMTDLQDPDGIGTDEHGRTMTRLYKQRCGEIVAGWYPQFPEPGTK